MIIDSQYGFRAGIGTRYLMGLNKIAIQGTHYIGSSKGSQGLIESPHKLYCS